MAYGKRKKRQFGQFDKESEDAFIAPKKTAIRYHGDADSEVPPSERTETTIELTPEQDEAFCLACEWHDEPLGSDLFTLGGYAGTGKTTLTAQLAKEWVEDGDSVGFCTFTWKAAQVLKRKLRAIGVNASPTSLHGLMYIPVTDTKGNIIRWQRRPSIDYSTVIVDEASMLTEQLMDDLLDYGVKVLAVGDHAQLPPIDGPSVLTSLDAELTQVCRQAQDSPIIRLATHVRLEGDFGQIPDGIAVMDDDDEIQRARADDVARYGELDVATLTYTNRSRVTANHYIRSYLQRQGAPSPGDVVMCLSNQPPLFNGMRGLVSGEAFYLQRDHWYLGTVDFPDEILWEYR
jgi:exodeoxyribonuclease-5